MKQLGKRVLMLLVFVFAINGLVSLACAQAPKDVPANHVAAGSVNLLIAKGYLPLYDDGTFRGNSSVDRYTLAIALEQLLKDVEAGKVRMSEDDLKLLQRLSTEFREDLVLQGVQLDRLKSDVNSHDAVIEKLRAEVAALRAELAAQQQSASNIQTVKNELASQQNTANNTLDRLKTEVASIKAEVSAFTASQSATQDRLRVDVASVKAELATERTNQARIEANQGQELDELSKRIAKLSESVGTFEARLAAMSLRIDKGIPTSDNSTTMVTRLEAVEREISALKSMMQAETTKNKNMVILGAAAGVMLSIIVGGAK